MSLKNKIPEDWLCTNEIAKKLNVSPKTIRGFKSKNKLYFKGLTKNYSLNYKGKIRCHVFWSPEAQRILANNINKPIIDKLNVKIQNLESEININKIKESDIHTKTYEKLPDNFYNSKEYALWGIKILKKFGYKCIYCGKPANHTDHLRSAQYYPKLALEIENGIATCEECH